VTFSILDGKIVEGHGVEPDIEVSMDFDAWDKGNGSDSQLDRALQFIRTGN
jgi:C-terminal processing protease CtpA/Prc